MTITRIVNELDLEYPKITVIIPTIPPRSHLLHKAISSALDQSLPPREIIVSIDNDHEGVARTRNHALDAVDDADFVAFLDDDDYFYHNHLSEHYKLNADFTYSWFTGNNPFPQHRGKMFDKQNPHHTTITVMISKKLQHIRFRTDHPKDWILPQEDWRYILDCSSVENAIFKGTSEITWNYTRHHAHTSGLPHRW